LGFLASNYCRQTKIKTILKCSHNITDLVVVRHDVARRARAVVQASRVEAGHDAPAAVGDAEADGVGAAVEQRGLHAGGHGRVGPLDVGVLGDRLEE